MKKLVHLATIMTIIIAIAVMPVPADAKKPQREVNGEMVYVGNGYPSGPHFNLNFLAKWLDTFICPTEAEYDSETPDKNVIYVPRSPSQNIGVLIESGRRGPKNSIDQTVLEVTDWCTEDFPDQPDGDRDDAAMRLPPDPVGYLVYARITGKPVDANGDSFYANLGGCLKYAEDSSGNDLILLGLVSSDGESYVPTCDDGDTPGDTIELMRTNSSSGKGVKKATNITSIFLWSGQVCDIVTTVAESNTTFCCVDADSSGDGVYEHCDPLDTVGIGDPLVCPISYTGDIDGTSGTWPYTTVYASCSDYTNEWVFNVADFVGYLWSVESSGAYNIKVRFYPCSEQPSGACGEIGS